MITRQIDFRLKPTTGGTVRLSPLADDKGVGPSLELVFRLALQQVVRLG